MGEKISKKITIYEPDLLLKSGFFSIIYEIYRELKQNIWLIYQLGKRDLLSSYKQSFLGILWAIFFPILSIIIFVSLNQSGILNIGNIGLPYSIYALIGIAFWQLFSNVLVACSNSLINAGPMIYKINFSKKSLVIAAASKAMIPFFIQLLIIFPLFLIIGKTPSLMALMVPVLIIPLLLFTLGLGFFASLVNGIFRDFGNIISILLVLIMFFTPILYEKPKFGLLAYITKYNPLYYLINVPRDFILKGFSFEIKGFLIVSIITFIIFLGSLYAFHLSETRVAERI